MSDSELELDARLRLGITTELIELVGEDSYCVLRDLIAVRLPRERFSRSMVRRTDSCLTNPVGSSTRNIHRKCWAEPSVMPEAYESTK
jgi:hypothetical protein